MKGLNFNQPYQLFWGSIILLWIAVLVVPAEAIDLQIHDTYFVIAYYHWALFFTIILGGMGFLYWIFKGKGLIRWMTIFHSLVTIIPIISLFIWNGFPKERYFSNYIQVDMMSIFIAYWGILLLFLLGQIFFIINLLSALFKE